MNKLHLSPQCTLSGMWRSGLLYRGAFALIAAFSSSLLIPSALFSQDEDEEDDVYVLSPFSVEGEDSQGYMATSTLAGTRLNTQLEDVGSAISVFTEEFLEDVGATDNESLLLYGTNTEVGGVRGNYTGVGNGATPTEGGLFVRPNNNTRVRGLAAADNTRNYFRSLIPFDSYNTARVDIVRGANAILFGLGSPAGIINTTTDSAAFADSNEVTVRFDQYGSYRASANFNQEVVKDELAVRLSLLNDNTKYRQDPAFSDATRAYFAARWDPASLNTDSMTTSLKFSYEDGEIDSNRPRMMTPKDQITPFFKSGSGAEGGLGGMTVNQYISTYYGGGLPETWSSPEDIPMEDVHAYPQGLKGFDSAGNNLWGMSSQQSSNRNPWLRNFGNIFDGLISFSNSNTSNEFQQARYRPHNDGTIQGTADGRWAGVSGYSRFAELAQLPHWDLGVYKDRYLNDPSIFDYENHLLEGPNKNEFNDFDGYQITLAQTFLNGKLGYEIGVDHQEGDWGQTSLLNGENGNSINIDINEVRPDGSPNPNVGRAAITSNYLYGNNESFQEMDQLRATVFAKVDLEEQIGDNFLGRLLGNHTFTGFFADDEDTLERRNYARYAAPLFFSSDVLQSPDPQITGPTRRINVVHYISGDLRGQSAPTGLSAIDRVVLPPSQGTMNYFDPTWIAEGVDPTAAWIDPYFPRGGALTEFDNPANYVGWNNIPFSPMDATTDLKNDMYLSADMTRTEIESKAFVWQGFLLDGAIVPMVGLREDEAKSYSHQAPNTSEFIVDISDPSYKLPSQASGQAKGDTETYSLVAHVDRLIGTRLPGNLGLSLFYNESENFQPAAQRVNHLGQSIASPTGSTEDYGFQLTSVDNKYSLRVNWYETNVTNATYEGGFASAWALGWSTTMPWAYAKKAQNKVESFQVSGWNPEGGYSNAPLMNVPPEIGWDVGGTFTEQQALDGFFDYFNNLPQEFVNAWNLKVDEAQWMINGWPAGMGFQPPLGLAATSDNLSEGMEAEFIANPTDNWRISLSVSKTEATRKNVGGDIAKFVEERAAAYDGPAGAVRLWGPNPSYINSIRQWFRGYMWGDYQLAKLQEGSDAPEIRKWRANLVTNYNFTEGALEGVNIGGSARYMSGSIVGYPVIPNVGGDTDSIWDIADPYKSDSETRIDFWLGYQRKLSDKINWKIQLNVTDAFADDTLIPITVQPNGSYGALRIPPSTSWFITNTFMF